MRQMLLGLAVIALANIEAAAQTTVHFIIDAGENVRPISRLIYGVNQDIGGTMVNPTFMRFGGNRTTAYNWVTNASNAGKDYLYQSDAQFTGGSTPGGALIPFLREAYDQDAGALITIPTNGYVSADEAGPVDIHDPGRFAKRFKREEPAKGSAFGLRPDPAAPVVYQDEFVNWVKTNYAYGQTDPNRQIYFALDNEPDIWAETHPEAHPAKLTYAELIEKTIAYSTAIKNVEPNTLVYGPVNYGWGGIFDLQKAPDAGGRDFETFYLHEMAAASQTAGKRLIDVLDIHWYPEVTGGGVRITGPETAAAVVAARLQAARSLWDPTYTETSWVTQSSTHGPIDLIPMLQKKIAENFPGTKLSISEYNYGGGADISGGIAEADVLGTFGKMGLFSANEWQLKPNESFIAGALAMYRNFDGRKSCFGDTSISATTDDEAHTSVYASVDSTNSDRMIVVAINKSNGPITAKLQLNGVKQFSGAEVYQLTRAKPVPAPAGELSSRDAGNYSYELPPYSVSTIRFVAFSH
jgi:glycosyl hydrolase family 44